eukprot:gene16141-19206_t
MDSNNNRDIGSVEAAEGGATVQVVEDQEELTRQRIQKRKDEAKRIIEERKKREQQQQQGTADEEEEEEQQVVAPKKKKKAVKVEVEEDDDEEEEQVVVKKPKKKIGSAQQPVSNNAPIDIMPNIREDMVRRAVVFLSNPNVKNTALGRKVAYLEKKGLTTDEIKEALKRYEAGPNSSSSSSSSAAVNSSSSTMTPASVSNSGGRGVAARGRTTNTLTQAQYGTEDDDRRSQLYAANNTFSWGNMLMTATAMTAVVSGLVFVTNNYILPYFRAPKMDRDAKTDKKIADLQEQLQTLQQSISTQSNEFKELMAPLKTLIEQNQKASQLNNTSTEISDIKRELKNLTSLINSPSSSSSGQSPQPTIEESEFRIPPNNNNNNSNPHIKGSSTANTNSFIGSGGMTKGSTAPRLPPIVTSNPYSNLTWKPATDTPPTIPSWQQKSSPSSISITSPLTPTGSSTPVTNINSFSSSPSKRPQMMDTFGTKSGQQLDFSNTGIISEASHNANMVVEDMTQQESATTTTTTTTTSSTPTPTKDVDTPYSSDFVDIINQLKQGKTPPGIRTDINDSPLPNGSVNKGTKERPLKPWEKANTTLTAIHTEEDTKMMSNNQQDPFETIVIVPTVRLHRTIGNDIDCLVLGVCQLDAYKCNYNVRAVMINIASYESMHTLEFVGDDYASDLHDLLPSTLAKAPLSLSCVDLSMTDMTDLTVKDIATVLALLPNLTRVSFQGNPLGDQGMADLCEALKLSKSLTDLDVQTVECEEALNFLGLLVANNTLLISLNSSYPSLVVVDDLYQTFRRAGFIQEHDDGTPKIIFYTNEAGERTGDAVICFARKESIPLAIQLFDDMEIVPGYKISLARATPEQVETKQQKVTSKSKRSEPKDKRGEKKREMNYGWGEAESRVVVIKNLFDPVESWTNINFFDELKEDLDDGCQRCGEIQSITIFERNPDGVATIKFKDQEAADKCVALMEGRFFAQRKLAADYYDGFTDYHVEETEEEKEKRMKVWEKDTSETND